MKHKQTIEILRKLSNKRIDYLEKAIEKNRIKELLQYLINENFLSNEIGNMIGRDRHALHKWYKRYDIKPLNYEGNKKSILILTDKKEKHETKYGRYEKIDGKYYRTYYIYPTEEFAYLIGLILGDGSVDNCKIYIVGGKPYEFLDKTYKRIGKIVDYLGDRSIKILYFTQEDKETKRADSNVSYWRIYIYWSALCNLFKNKFVLQESLMKIWSKDNLFNAFTAGLFDSDGYFVMNRGKPNRIGIEQSNKKEWFSLYCNHLILKYDVWKGKRKRNYKIIQRNKEYTGVLDCTMLTIKMSSWNKFIDNIIKPYCNKISYIENGDLFKEHALKVKSYWEWRL